MARTKQTARKSTGGKAPRKQLAARSREALQSYMTSHQAAGNMQVAQGEKQQSKASSINYENIFHSFGFLVPTEPAETFSAHFTTAQTVNNSTGVPEIWLAASFVSKHDGDGMQTFPRPAIALAFVLDISGSMASSLDSGDWGSSSKLAVAQRCLLAILDQLRVGDSLSFVVFNHTQNVVIPLTPIDQLDKATVRSQVMGLEPAGGTNLAAGFKAGLDTLKLPPNSEQLQRIFFLTDMQSGASDESEVLNLALHHASVGRHTTVVGIGVELSVGTVQRLSSIVGAHYVSVASAEEFEGSVGREFEYNVTPIAFDIKIKLPDGWSWAKGFGSPEVNAVGTNTKLVELAGEFANAKTPEGEVMGGILLFKLQKPQRDDAQQLQIDVEWQEPLGGKRSSVHNVALPTPELNDTNVCLYGSSEIRKAVALVRYVETVNNYILDDSNTHATTKADHVRHVETMTAFHNWLRCEMAACADTSLDSTNQSLAMTLMQIIEIESAAANDTTPPPPPPASDMTSFMCPITHALMVDPVMAADGHSYEREAIEKWLETKDTSPLTNLPLASTTLLPNHSLRAAIAERSEQQIANAKSPTKSGQKSPRGPKAAAKSTTPPGKFGKAERKVGTNKKADQNSPSEEPKRKRGRPPKKRKNPEPEPEPQQDESGEAEEEEGEEEAEEEAEPPKKRAKAASPVSSPVKSTTSTPVKRGRGRPKKVHRGRLPTQKVIPVLASPVRDSPVAKSPAPSSETPRKRGRPKKVIKQVRVTSPAEEPEQDSPKRRDSPAPVSPAPTTPKRGRGRPKKITSPDPAPIHSPSVDSEKQETPVTTPKKRGRPRKYPLESTPNKSTPGSETPRKRGRPRKHPIGGPSPAKSTPVKRTRDPSPAAESASPPAKRAKPSKSSSDKPKKEAVSEPVKRGRGRPPKNATTPKSKSKASVGKRTRSSFGGKKS